MSNSMHVYSHQHTCHHYHHGFWYLLLFLLMATGFFSFVSCTGQPYKQLQIGLILGITYALWGIFHHHHCQDLHWKIVVEYIAISLVGVGLLWILLSYIY